MEGHSEVLNRFLVDAFNAILRVEEQSLARRHGDLSLRELHLIEEVCRRADEGRDNRATAVAAAQSVTAGTLTTAVTLLERKGYLERRRDERDKRVVRILPTEKARKADADHAAFHHEMVESILTELSGAEAEALARALGCLSAFLEERNAEKP